MGKFFDTQGHVTLDNPLWHLIEFHQDFKPVLVICKFEEDPIKIEGAMVSITFFPALKGR